MADISMCQNSSCPLKSTCYRQTAPVNPYRQTFASFVHYVDADGIPVCDHYVYDHNTTKRKEKST